MSRFADHDAGSDRLGPVLALIVRMQENSGPDDTRAERVEQTMREVASKLSGVRTRLTPEEFDGLVRRIAEATVKSDDRERATEK